MYSIIHLPGLGMRSLQAVPQSDSHGMPGCFDVRCVGVSMESGLGAEMGLSENGTPKWPFFTSWKNNSLKKSVINDD